jgi:anti-sigma factor RsiW
MRCKKYRGFLEEWLDGELSGEERSALERHLQSCMECARYLEQRRRLGLALKADLLAMTAELHFQPRAANGLPGKKRRPGRMTRPHFNPRGLLALAAAALIVLLFIFQPWAKPRQKSVVGKSPTAVITVSDSLNAVDESFISGRIDGFTYLIRLRVSDVRISGHS